VIHKIYFEQKYSFYFAYSDWMNQQFEIISFLLTNNETS